MATPPTFTTGAVLTSAQMNAVGMWEITSYTATSNQGAFTINSAFSGDYDSYRLIWSGGVGVGAGSISVTLGASVAGYGWSLPYVVYGTGVGAGTSVGPNAASFPLVGTFTTAYGNFDMTLDDPFKAKYTRIFGAYTSLSEAGMYAGIHAVATSYTSITITPVTANINGGTFTLYGVRN
jgi:hypothetical protein